MNLSICLLTALTINDKILPQDCSCLTNCFSVINEIDAHLFPPQRVPVAELETLSSPDSAYNHIVSGLIGGTNYTFWMTSSTEQGDGGIQSEPQTVFLPEYGQS